MNVDVLVFGGGPAGAATALAARRRGLSVVVERSVSLGVRVGEHLSPSTLSLLARLGILGSVAAGQHRRSAGVRSAWGEADLRDRDYLFCAEGIVPHREQGKMAALPYALEGGNVTAAAWTASTCPGSSGVTG